MWKIRDGPDAAVAPLVKKLTPMFEFLFAVT